MNDTLDELNRETARYRRIKADREELKLALERGELVEVAKVRKAWGDMAGNVRKKMLALEARLPGKIAGKSTQEMYAVIHDEVYEILGELSEYTV